MLVFKKLIKIPIYFGKLLVIVSVDWEYVNKTYKFDLNNETSACVFETVDRKGVTTFVVAFTEINPSSDKIAHEAVHLVGLLFKNRGILADFNNDEPFAYMLGWTVKSINSLLLKIKVGSKELNK